jgi:hypothetical protein
MRFLLRLGHLPERETGVAAALPINDREGDSQKPIMAFATWPAMPGLSLIRRVL